MSHYLVTAIDYNTRQTRKFTVPLLPMCSFKVNAEQEINRRSNGRRWTVLDMQPLSVVAPF